MAATAPRILIFTDLDGSLLDHHDYGWAAAQPALELLVEREIPVIFNTSKTLEEVLVIQRKMGIDQPFISENGMVTTIPADYFRDSCERTHFFHGQPYRSIRRILSNIRHQHGFRFAGFGDLTEDQVAEVTGLSIDEAGKAIARKASEPVIWRDGDAELREFVRLLESQGLYLTRGGRFYHVSGKGSKGLALQALLQRYQQEFPEETWQTCALGDGINDLPMLEAADYPVLILSEHGQAPDVSHLVNVVKTRSVGPQGWNQTILDLFGKS
ncbi:HAD-IIB family hydrolase [Thalassotalea sp. G20_0]|uniref:HAD-IIB family hydrolase n=1 Tax=Thalassotalea sp. G20_0 TaxID=2821093 RepID=UPI001ADB56DC|nr:HAD-IIB family hydrolase [Thalassotalea sp. G20_0]MBO9493456.1 HAD-IIB family hydrolase [Thalassotalea sp. G20_0]